MLGAAPPANPAPLAANYPREFAGEPFFMAYGNLAAHDELSAKRIERIARYRTARLALLVELREQLSRGSDASALSALAAAQNPSLLGLEAEAEKIRHDLTHGELFKNVADDIGRMAPSRVDFTYENHVFNGGPSRLGYEVSDKKDPKLDAPLAAMRQLLSAAHSQDGFSLDQRRLLEEMAQEIMLTIEPEPGPAAVFFWPAGARIRRPAGLTDGAAAQFEDFQQRKAALKEELRAALNQGKAHRFNLDTTEANARLAAAQAPRFAELDALADQIRPALAALADANDRLALELPADLARQITSVMERKAALQRELYAQLAAFRQELTRDRIELVRQSNGLAITIVTENDKLVDRDAVLARIKAFNEEMAERFTALATMRDRLRDALARYQANAPGKAGVTVDRIAADFLAAYHAREYRNRQRDYAAAVLGSGLSPAQRRLLLAAAAVDSLQEPPASAP